MKVIKVNPDETKFLKELNNSTISTYLNYAHFETTSTALIFVLKKVDIEKIADALMEAMLNQGITDGENKFRKQ